MHALESDRRRVQRGRVAELASVLRPFPIWIVVDEIYAALVYDGFEQRSLSAIAADLRERPIIVDGVSKRFAMTGFRIGWALRVARVAGGLRCAAGPDPSKLRPAWPQYAALAALDGPRDRSSACGSRSRRAARSCSSGSAPSPACLPRPEGAFYAFVDVREQLGRTLQGRLVNDDLALAELLLDEARVALCPARRFARPATCGSRTRRASAICARAWRIARTLG